MVPTAVTVDEPRPCVKRILFVTGTRADFGKLKPLMKRVDECPGLECRVFVTGMHTLARYGSTHEEIRKSGFANTYLFINQMASQSSAMDLVVSNTISGLGHYVREFPPDMLVVHGDRVEALAGAIVGSLNNILVAHVEGGEVSGTVDELIRHAVTKLAHLHFVSNQAAAVRLVQMGERPESVFAIGSPNIDIMLSDTLPTIEEAKARYDIPFTDYGIFVYHPVTTETHGLRRNIQQAVQALQESEWCWLVIHPNNDTGSEIILEELDTLTDPGRFRRVPSFRFEHFLTLLKNAKAIVGNSSAGVREAPVYGVPTVNIGTRQKNRFVHASILNVPEDAHGILKALENLPARLIPSTHFGNGGSAERFVELLRTPEVWSAECQKQFRDLA